MSVELDGRMELDRDAELEVASELKMVLDAARELVVK